MTATFAILAVLTLASAAAAMALRNLVHCALALAAALAGLAALYLQLGAQFVGFAQVLIYVGAVAILIVFAILLTRGSEPPQQSVFSTSWAIGVAMAGGAFAVLGSMVLTSKVVVSEVAGGPAGSASLAGAQATVRQIGDQLMTRYILPLEILGLLLTAALIGAVLIAMQERKP